MLRDIFPISTMLNIVESRLHFAELDCYQTMIRQCIKYREKLINLPYAVFIYIFILFGLHTVQIVLGTIFSGLKFPQYAILNTYKGVVNISMKCVNARTLDRASQTSFSDGDKETYGGPVGRVPKH